MKADIRQFLIYTEPVERDDFIVRNLENGFFLSYENHLGIRVFDNGLILLGEAIPVKEEVYDKLSALSSTSIEVISDIVKFLSGRWVVIWKNLVISDACALMGLYFAGDCISTSLNLINLFTSHHDSEPFFRKPVYGDSVDWVVTPLTRLKGVRHMLCTQYLVLDSETGVKEVHHEFISSFPHIEEPLVHSELLECCDRFFRIAAERYGTLVLPLTAGADSRTLLALAIHSGVCFSTVTFDRDGMEASEREVPARISKICGIRHDYVLPSGDDGKLRSLWHTHTFDSCASEDENFLARGQFSAIPEGALMIRGNVWEIATCAWWKRLPSSLRGRSLRQVIADAMPQMDCEALRLWVSDFERYGRGMDWRDAVFYEQRESAWLGSIEQSLDLLPFSHLTPVNSAYLLSLMLSLDLSLRKDKVFQKHLISQILPQIADIPYNGRTLVEKVRHYRKQSILLVGRKLKKLCSASLP